MKIETVPFSYVLAFSRAGGKRCALHRTSDGSNVAGRTIRTTNDMPIVERASPDALGSCLSNQPDLC